MFKSLYDRLIALAESRHAPYALAAVAFAESSVFPIPPDVLLAPMALAQPRRAWFYALICTIASVLGGMLGYAIGALLFDTVGQWLIHFYGYADRMASLKEAYAKWGALIILFKGLTPIPFKLVTIVSGLLGYNFAVVRRPFHSDAGPAVLPGGGRAASLGRSLAHRFGAPFRGVHPWLGGSRRARLRARRAYILEGWLGLCFPAARLPPARWRWPRSRSRRSPAPGPLNMPAICPATSATSSAIAYYAGIPLALLTAAAVAAKAPRLVIAAGFGLIAALFLYNAGLAIYHSGVEAKYWAGPTACTGGSAIPSGGGDLLQQLQSVRVVRCDEVSLRVFGLSLANWNIFISAALAVLAAASLARKGGAK